MLRPIPLVCLVAPDLTELELGGGKGYRKMRAPPNDQKLAITSLTGTPWA